MEDRPAAVYILQCRDRSFYTGYTTDIRRRIRMHQCKKGSRYTASRLPVRLVYIETGLTKSQALRREYQIRKLSHQEKESLIAHHTRRKH